MVFGVFNCLKYGIIQVNKLANANTKYMTSSPILLVTQQYASYGSHVNVHKLYLNIVCCVL